MSQLFALIFCKWCSCKVPFIVTDVFTRFSDLSEKTLASFTQVSPGPKTFKFSSAKWTIPLDWPLAGASGTSGRGRPPPTKNRSTCSTVKTKRTWLKFSAAASEDERSKKKISRPTNSSCQFREGLRQGPPTTRWRCCQTFISLSTLVGQISWGS